MNNDIIQQLRHLKLTGMAHALLRQTKQPMLHLDMHFDERLQLLLEHELTHRSDRAIARRLKDARFKTDAALEQLDGSSTRGINRAPIAELAQGNWLNQHHNLLVTGATGCGKTWLTCALGKHMCLQGYSVRYVRTSRLLDALNVARGDGSYRKQLQQLAKVDWLILDDFGLEPLNQRERCDLLELMDDRHGQHSTAVLSQLPVGAWHDVIGEPTIADAILDRLIHSAYRIELKGESLRKKRLDTIPM
jgi:DNA replication protein DnaC